MKSIRLSWTLVLLALVLALALAARTYGLDFPRYHWDENFDFDSVFYASFSHLALQTYVHGSLFQYLTLLSWYAYMILVGVLPTTQNLLLSFFRDPTVFYVLARGLSALAGIANVAAVYFLGKRLYGSAVGLLAAFFLALTFLHVSESHYARGHSLSTFFVTLAVYFCARILDEQRARNYVLAGVSIGLATAAQYTAVLAILPLVAAHLLKLRAQSRQANWKTILLNRSLLLGLDSAAIAFFIATPYALLNFPYFAGELKWFITQEASRTWVSAESQPVLLFYLSEHLRNGMGLGLEIVALAGVVYALFRHRIQDWLWLAFALPLFVTLNQGPNFARYALPLLPFLSIAGARILVDAMDWAIILRIPTRWARVALIVLAIALVIPTAINVVRFDYWLTQPDTRLFASDWWLANIPDGATVVVEGAGVLGPAVSTGRAQMEAQLSAEPANSIDYLRLQAIQANSRAARGYQVTTIFRLDQQVEGGTLVGTIPSAQYYAERGIDYLITTSWMQRDDTDRYSSDFQKSLDAAYERIAEFEPTIAFRFDPYAWRMDYDALARVVPRKPVIGGPRITIYRRRGAD